MIPPLLSQSSRQLLQRFFIRESQRSAILASSNSSSSSSDPSSSASTPSNTTPQHLFKGEVTRNVNGHVRYKKPRYNPRQQKKLFRAMEIVKMQNELFGSAIQPETQQSSSGLSSSSADGEDVPVIANTVVRDTFGAPLPQDWKLPTSSKIQSTLSFFDDGASAAATSPAGRSNREIDALSRKSASHSSSSSSTSRQYTFKDATSRGPYKGRSAKNVNANAKNQEDGPFKLHKWERTKEATRLEREEKLKSMPARMEEYTKVSPLLLS
jgi:hypothetical protein